LDKFCVRPLKIGILVSTFKLFSTVSLPKIARFKTITHGFLGVKRNVYHQKS